MFGRNTFLGTITYPIPAGTFESMMFLFIYVIVPWRVFKSKPLPVQFFEYELQIKPRQLFPKLQPVAIEPYLAKRQRDRYLYFCFPCLCCVLFLVPIACDQSLNVSFSSQIQYVDSTKSQNISKSCSRINLSLYWRCYNETAKNNAHQ